MSALSEERLPCLGEKGKEPVPCLRRKGLKYQKCKAGIGSETTKYLSRFNADVIAESLKELYLSIIVQERKFF